MLFNSAAFLLVFLPLSALAYRVADPYPGLRIPTLIASSFIFYGYWDVRFVPLLAASIAINWLVARAFASSRNAGLIVLAIAANLAVLGFFKYWNFFADNLRAVVALPASDVTLPLGISFFTFHHIMYLVDLRRGQAPLYPFGRYALYICFFPQVLSGPLVRWNEVMEQFGRSAFAPGWEERWGLAIAFIIVGLLEKVALGDRLAGYVDPVYADAARGAVAGGRAWIGMAGFTFQVFFDFAGYSDIAIGLGLLFNIRLPLNFDAPFRASSYSEFWQRWHITLSRFLRDYVFRPLLRVRLSGRRHRWAQALVAVIITFALCGLWHGAGWHFVLWGVAQGLAVVFAALWRGYLPSPPRLIGWAATVGWFILAMPLFRASNLEAAWRIYQGLVVPVEWQSMQGTGATAIAFASAVLLPAGHVICQRVASRPRPLVAVGLAGTAAAILVMLGSDTSREFIYFQF